MRYWIQILSIVVSLFAAAAFVYHGAGGLRERYLDYGLIISIFVALFSVLLLPFQHVVDKGFRELNKKVDELIERQKREMQNVENSFRRIIDDTEYIEHVAFGGWVHVRRERALEYDINEMKRMEKMENNKNTFFYSTYVFSEGRGEDLEDITYKEYVTVLVSVSLKGIDVKRVVISDNGIDDFTPDFKKHLLYLNDNGIEVSVVRRESLYSDKAQNFVVFCNESEQVGMAYPFIKGSDGRVFKYAVNYKSEVGRGAEWYKEYYEYFEKLFGGGVPINEFVTLWRGDAK